MSMSTFDHAHHFGIHNAAFNTVTHANHVNFNHHTTLPLSDNAADLLRSARAVEATHTSNTASHATKCHPKTRIKVIADMASWVTGPHDAEQPKNMLWFPGPAGGGKTCIMRAVVGRCEEADLLTASYFFSAESGLNQERPFMATIAHQVSMDPVLGPLILEAIRRRPSIFDESLALQMEKLVIEPLRLFPRRVLIAVDGFDECTKVSERKHLFGLLYKLARSLPNIVIIIASRPEVDIRSTSEQRKFKKITHILRLEDYDGRKDTRVFICEEFKRIRETHPLKRYIPVGWPLEKGVGILHDRSSGNFIFPSAAMKYIAKPRKNPVESLEEVLALSSDTSLPSGASHGNPLAELDSLYALILHPPETDLAMVKRILHCMIRIHATSSFPTSSSFLGELLGLPPSAINMALCDLHSVISVPESSDEPIRFHHKSLQDYLLSPTRSLDMFQESYTTNLDLALCCVRRLEAWASDPNSGNLKRPSTAQYSALFWDAHISRLTSPTRVPLPTAMLSFDPRTIWRVLFISNLMRYRSIWKSQSIIHRSVCAEGPCTQLCGTLCWMLKCEDKAKAFENSVAGRDKSERSSLLSQFDVESGLYDQNARIPNTFRIRWHSATFPGTGAWSPPSSVKAIFGMPPNKERRHSLPNWDSNPSFTFNRRAIFSSAGEPALDFEEVASADSNPSSTPTPPLALQDISDFQPRQQLPPPNSSRTGEDTNASSPKLASSTTLNFTSATEGMPIHQPHHLSPDSDSSDNLLGETHLSHSPRLGDSEAAPSDTGTIFETPPQTPPASVQQIPRRSRLVALLKRWFGIRPEAS